MPPYGSIPVSYNEILRQRFAKTDPNFNSEYRESVARRYREIFEQFKQTQLRLQKRIENVGLEKAIEEALGFKRMKQLKHDNVVYMRNGRLWTVNGNQPVELLDTAVVAGAIYKINIELFDLIEKLDGLEDFSGLLTGSDSFNLKDLTSTPSLDFGYVF
ncbi:hypothetical protein K493DRAFT_339808 [Basidiobolus meristosporus CBS 931.73]|uniref:Uncharacterized protein n=1 Tax=Basidiobolus meristosporus CBS 931.73 TaxID=1314790 RepID=A0A1Y1XYA0_9FUNG|nr:hypothetical protein K493DRAFT_339808 [Basidiobolus meristosporus CBS 931.73]|eukprot:ORX90728.1 hypothetical protein K493DRAFT_339808 [Basidiobolus meristosporus CBS 931.73]